MALIAGMTGLPAAASEPPAIERLVPPGGQRGTTVEVALVGKPGDGPLQVWSDRGQLSLALAEERDKAAVTIPADAEPGVHWLRFYNPFGATELKPFFVGVAAEVLEKEPNDQPQEAQRIDSLPITINGVLDKTGEVDVFAVSLQAGQSWTASVQANRELGSPMDAVLEVLDSKASRIASCDDDQGIDPQIRLAVSESGQYFVRLFAFPSNPNSSIQLAGSKDYQYRLTLMAGTPELPVVPMDPAARATPRTIPWSLNDRIAARAESAEYHFDGFQDQSVTVQVAARQHGSPLDPVAVLQGPDGKLIQEFDDISGDNPDVEFAVKLPADGRYTLTVRDRFAHGGERYTYVVGVAQSEPSFEATVASAAFVVGPDKPLEIPVTITRRHGFAEEISVAAEGLPEGVLAATQVSKSDGDSSKSVTLKVERTAEAGAFAGPIQIVCQSQDQRQPATAPSPDPAQRTAHVWLTVLP